MADKFIYGLADPRNGVIGYVGCSRIPLERFKQHCREPGGKGPVTALDSDGEDHHGRKHRWLRLLRASGCEPQLVILDVVSEEFAAVREAEWIERMRTVGEAVGNGHSSAPKDRRVGHAAQPGALRNERTRLGLTLREVALSLGVSESAVSRWEVGNRVIPKPIVQLLRDKLGIRI